RKTRRQTKATADPDEVAKNALITYLHDELVRTKFQSNASGAELVAEALNTFLTDPNLFAEERFSNYWLNSATRSLRELHTSSAIPGYSSGGPLTDHDLKHFNRLLLEDSFPQSLKKIHRIRLDAIYKCIHEKQPAALCFSGGGIRSGTFALGILQGLARHDLLNKFHFLSTVSGGGYIGSWLAAWIHRHPAGLSGVTTDLANQHRFRKSTPIPIRSIFCVVTAASSHQKSDYSVRTRGPSSPSTCEICCSTGWCLSRCCFQYSRCRGSSSPSPPLNPIQSHGNSGPLHSTTVTFYLPQVSYA